MTTEEQTYIHYLRSYTAGRLFLGVPVKLNFDDDNARNATACMIGVRDGAVQAEPKTKSQVVAAVEALLL